MQKNRMLLAMMAEYSRVTDDVFSILREMDQEEFIRIRDTKTSDPDCKSIQTVCFHIIQSGYTYANYWQKMTGSDEWLEYDTPCDTPETAILEIYNMLGYSEQALQAAYQLKNAEISKLNITSRWGTVYDYEQLFEHAIVHILRHRRQIENFLIE